MSNIPVEVIELVAEATSEYNDGWTKKAYRQRLLEIRGYINGALGECEACIKCGRPLVVPRHLRFAGTPKGKVCIPCTSSIPKSMRRQQNENNSAVATLTI